MNIDLVARQPQALLRRTSFFEKLSSIDWHKAAFIAFWEGQGHLSTFAYVALVAFTSIWVAFGAMFVWSVLATLFFVAARERGYPNLLSSMSTPRLQPGHLAWFAVGSVCRAWLAGVNAFAFTRCSGFLITQKQGSCRARRLALIGALGIGLTLFGVTAAEHLLRTAGYSGRKLARLTLIGPFLHVPYRVMVSAAVVALFTDALGVVTI